MEQNDELIKEPESENSKNPDYQQVIKIANYVLKAKPIGKGSYGTVFLAKNENNEYFAAKRIDLSLLESDKRLKEKFMSEARLYHHLKSKHIIHLHDLQKTKNHIYLFLEYCDSETLESFLNKYQDVFNHLLSPSLLQFFVSQIVEGLSYMAAHNCIHRDLKPENIMISSTSNSLGKSNINSIVLEEENILKISLKKSLNTYNVFGKIIERPKYFDDDIIKDESVFENEIKKNIIKIIDLGFARELDNEGYAQSACGTPAFIAPEIFDALSGGTKFGQKVDLWSLGVTIYNLAFGKFPFNGPAPQKFMNEFKIGLYEIPNTPNVSLELIDIINGLLKRNVTRRYSWNHIINHPFLIKDPKNFTKFDFQGKKSLTLNINDSLKVFIEKIVFVKQLTTEDGSPINKPTLFNPLRESTVDITNELFYGEDDWAIVNLK